MNTFKKIASIFAIVALFYSATAFVIPMKVNAAGQPFGGFAASYVPPSPLCPFGHQVIFDYVTKTVMGIAVMPNTQIFQNYKFYASAVYLLGSILPTPLPCVLPYPVYPALMEGTS